MAVPKINERACSDCKHYQRTLQAVEYGEGRAWFHMCGALIGTANPVDGAIMALPLECSAMRMSSVCGWNGDLFEARESDGRQSQG